MKPRSWLFTYTFYFLFFAAGASLIPYLVLYFDQRGLSGVQIGLLTSLSRIITLLAASAWAALADAFRKHQLLLWTSLAAAIASALGLMFSTSFALLLIWILGLNWFVAPIMPLVDNSTIQRLGDQSPRYGRIRLWGAVGWGIAGPLAGWLVQRSGLEWAFYSYMGLMLASLLVASQLQVAPWQARQPFRRSLSFLTSDRRLWLLLTLAFFAGAGISTISNYLFLFLDGLSASKTLMGLSLTTATISEVPVWFFADRLIKRWGAARLIPAALFAGVVRLLCISSLGNPAFILLIEMLHGATYSLFWSAGVNLAAQFAPPEVGATSQGIFSGVYLGLGSAVGAYLGGLVYSRIGLASMYRAFGVGMLLIFLFSLAAGLNRRLGAAAGQMES